MSNINNMKLEGSNVPAEEIKNPALKSAIVKMQEEGSKENIDAMVNAVLEAKLILPIKVTPITKAHTNNGKTVMEQQNQVQFRLLENVNKDKYLGVFTDIEELYKWKDTEKGVKAVSNFDTVATIVMDPNNDIKGFVIDAFGKSVTFPKPMVISIKQQRDYLNMKDNKIEPGSRVHLSDPKEFPIDLMASLINHFSTEPNVNSAYLRLMQQENGKKSYFIVVDFIGNMEETFEAISKVAKPYLDEEIELSMMPYSMEFARNAVNGVEPFYRKEQ